MVGNATEWCGNYIYQYTDDTIGDDPAKMKMLLEFIPNDEIPPFQNSSGSYYPAYRGGQYVDGMKPATANGWTRHGGGLPDLNTCRRGKSFRVLKEVR